MARSVHRSSESRSAAAHSSMGDNLTRHLGTGDPISRGGQLRCQPNKYGRFVMAAAGIIVVGRNRFARSLIGFFPFCRGCATPSSSAPRMVAETAWEVL